MNVGQILLPGASEYERKCQRIDRAILSQHETVRVRTLSPGRDSNLADELRESPIDLAHVYGDSATHASLLHGLPPYTASVSPGIRRFAIRRPDMPKLVAGPLTDPPLPEAVEDHYFGGSESGGARETKLRYAIGSYGPHRPGVTSLVQRTAARLERFRDDLDWMMFDSPPSPENLASVDVWVDPATDEQDLDGFAAEALVAGRKVVACRTAINHERLTEGSGFAVPVDDPNELAHAILVALFKEEIAEQRLQAAAAQSGRFHPSIRAAVLLELYNQILHG